MKFSRVLVLISLFVMGCSSSSSDSNHLDSNLGDDSGKDSPVEVIVPVATSITPNTLYTGVQVKVSGSHLGDTSITLNGAPVELTSQAEHEIIFTAPQWPAGEYSIVVEGPEGHYIQMLEYADNFKGVSASPGNNHTCAITEDTSVACWGGNSFGQLGDGTGVASVSPVAVSGLTDITAVSSSQYFTCALNSSGSVYCWGRNNYGQLGDGEVISSSAKELAPVQVANLTNVKEISTGYSHACALTTDDDVFCWGQNNIAQLGNGSGEDTSTPSLVQNLGEVTSLSVGLSHSCALISDGSMSCWGSNYYGQLGDGTKDYPTTAVAVVGLTDVKAVSAGSVHSCAIKNDDTVACWGYNNPGTLGNGTIVDSLTPVDVINLTDVTALESGRYHNCALKSDGTVACWGKNIDDQLGDDTIRSYSTEPVVTSNLNNIKSIHVNQEHSCAVTNDNDVFCWGQSSSNRLGYEAVDYPTATSVSGLTDVKDVGLGGAHSCALQDDMSVTCWGDTRYGQSGNGTTTGTYTPTTPVLGLDDAISVHGGLYHTCALRDTGTVVCWGRNDVGQLGNGSTEDALFPVEVLGLSNVIAVDLYESQGCALKDDGTVWCWGDNEYGQLGDGSTDGQLTPVAIDGLTDVVDISVGGRHSCALNNDGTAACWGSNSYGQLGNNSLIDALTPVTVSDLTNGVNIDAGDYHTCVLYEDNTVGCWGRGSSDRLHNGSTDDALTPTPVLDVSDVSSISVGGNFSCALLLDGTATCWGDNSDSSQLGNGSDGFTDILLPVFEVEGITDIYASSYFACVRYVDESLACWGNNSAGQLGQNFIKSPVLLTN
ncbi:alpha-tubulin suppressor-like RCC1 family protein [Reinekea marinisedimentorum]|uniref:Alpha-tubulin suppressor-like RCC1 family protein n=1 Tax=Reinekea marinisedimentorum TaxID=230495 RepID=A0A4R3I1Y3_9GAMM|nr:alpha-tubulin suppressor-like RCC1 family protein [Reinekea marinisedimentorum]